MNYSAVHFDHTSQRRHGPAQPLGRAVAIVLSVVGAFGIPAMLGDAPNAAPIAVAPAPAVVMPVAVGRPASDREEQQAREDELHHMSQSTGY